MTFKVSYSYIKYTGYSLKYKVDISILGILSSSLILTQYKIFLLTLRFKL